MLFIFLILLSLINAIPDKSTSTKTATNNTSTVTSTASTVTTSSIASYKEEPSPDEICVKCYDKTIVTPDCEDDKKDCVCKCNDGSTKKLKGKNNKQRRCSNVKREDIPCSCKDDEGGIIPENTYVGSSKETFTN